MGELALYNHSINKLCQMSFAEALQVCSGFGVQGPRSAFWVEGEINLLLELAYAREQMRIATVPHPESGEAFRVMAGYP